eukprot:CAMPEP_0115292004 /NCGR_PEP_ID=MMETSP0270-20121206/64902_1 /TAXON_ID=71861 /ORGANISM="Scrippsiella trochoidea, Strain CCMP3099" /LENGTH=35 /DNA_ID= /DNA_START= /DNA_END= /DNA_ORIENTATION=
MSPDSSFASPDSWAARTSAQCSFTYLSNTFRKMNG